MNNMTPSLKSFFTPFLVCLGICAYAQRDSVRVKIFSTSPQAEQQPAVSRHYEDKNYLRFNPYLIARGTFTVGYERNLHDKHALAIDAGPTYRDFLYEGLILGQDDEESAGSDASVKLGQYVDLSYKFYPMDYGEFDEAFYMSAGFIYRDYNVTAPVEYSANGSDLIVRDADAGYTFTETYLKLGYVSESWALDGVVWDVYFGVGYRNITRQTHEIIDLPTGGSILATGEEKKSVPCVYLGIKYGFSW